MLRNKQLKEWSCIVSEHMNHLSLPQVTGLATWSFGMVMTKSSSLTQVSEFIAALNGEKANTVRQRLKEWYQEAEAKSGTKRIPLDVTTCFASLLSWVVSLLPTDTTHIALAMDATSISVREAALSEHRFVVLSINILIAGGGIPVAWYIVKANQAGSWKPHWQFLIEKLKDVIPKHFVVILAADRGLYADWLFQTIVDAGWHPFLRINSQGLLKVPPSKEWKSLVNVIREPGQSWSGQVTCFKKNPLQSTLLARWDLGYKEPWLILTDFEPNQADALWYGLRPSTECVYRDVKSDGWQWQNTRLVNPQRAERLWLAIAVSTLWMVMLGGESELNTPPNNRQLLPQRHYFLSKPPKNKPLRHLSCFLLGCITLISDLLNNIPIHLNRWSSFPSNPVENFYCPNSS